MTRNWYCELTLTIWLKHCRYGGNTIQSINHTFSLSLEFIRFDCMFWMYSFIQRAFVISMTYTDKQSKVLKCFPTINSPNWTVINAAGERFVCVCSFSAVCMISR